MLKFLQRQELYHPKTFHFGIPVSIWFKVSHFQMSEKCFSLLPSRSLLSETHFTFILNLKEIAASVAQEPSHQNG
jgi:hypothetical protein